AASRLCFCVLRRPPRSPPFHYTTLFRSSLWQTWAMIALSHLGEIRELSARARAERERGEQCHDRFVLQMTDLGRPELALLAAGEDRKSTRLNSSHVKISYAVFCLKKKQV